MSYDLAVWEGDRPANDIAAAAQFRALFERYLRSDEPVEPTARIAAYVAALLDRYPDLGTEAGGGSPWSTDSLISQASGPLVYVPMAWSRSGEVSQWAAHLAEEHGLHCYDPQKQRLRTPWGQPWRFELTTERDLPVRDPSPEDVRAALVRLSADNYFAVLTRSDDWYIQAGYGEPANTRPGWYALERRDGAPERHHRAVVTSIEEVVQAFVGFLQGDPALSLRIPWKPYTA